MSILNRMAVQGALMIHGRLYLPQHRRVNVRLVRTVPAPPQGLGGRGLFSPRHPDCHAHSNVGIIPFRTDRFVFLSLHQYVDPHRWHTTKDTCMRMHSSPEREETCVTTIKSITLQVARFFSCYVYIFYIVYLTTEPLQVTQESTETCTG